MKTLLSAACALLVATTTIQALQIDYPALWEKATPFHVFLENVKARQDQWKPRFADAAIDAAALAEAKALPARRRILAVAEDRCSDSAWALPFIAKLAAAVPEKLELRVIGRAEGSRIQSAHLTPDGRLATPTIIVLDENDRYIGGWVERPAELQKWYVENKPKVSQGALYEHVNNWYIEDAGRSTIREILAILAREAAEGK
jgi:Thioredoxin